MSDGELASDDDSPQAGVGEEVLYSLINALLADKYALRATKRATLTALIDSSDLSKAIERVNQIMAVELGLKVVRIPERIGNDLKKVTPRHEYTVVSILSPALQKITTKYADTALTNQESRMRLVVMLVMAHEELPERRLAKFALDAGIYSSKEQFDEEMARFVSMRILELKKETLQELSTQLRTYTVGGTASLIYTKEEMSAYLFEYMEYSDETQTTELLAENKRIIEAKVDHSLGRGVGSK